MKSLISILTILIFTLVTIIPVYSHQDSDFQKLLKEGKDAYINGRYNEAIEKLSVAIRIIQAKNDLLDACIFLALAHFAVGDNENAVQMIKKILSIDPEITLNTDEYSPKFIKLLDGVKQDHLIKVTFYIFPSGSLFINGFLVQEGDVIEAKVIKGENQIKVINKGYETFEQNIMLLEDGASKEIQLPKIQESPKNGLVEEAAIEPKKKKKFPWLLVIGGIAVLAVVIYFIFIKKPKYTLTVSTGEGVNGTPASGSYSYNKNETVTYNYTAQSGYGLVTVTLDGQQVNNSGIIKMDKNHTLSVSSSGKVGTQHTLLVIKESGVEGNPATGSYTYNEGEIVNYVYTLASGYKNLTVKLNGNPVMASGSITMNADYTLQASAVAVGNQVILTVSRGSGVEGDPDSGSYTYASGEEVDYSYSLKTGYHNLVVKLDGQSVEAHGTITMDKDHSLNATADPSGTQNVTLTVDKGEGVSGTPNTGSYDYSKGTTVSYNYSLASGYKDLVVKLDGKPVNASSTIKMDTSHNLSASATSTLGKIRVTSLPGGAEIWLDGVNTGKTTTSTLADIAAGDHTITLKKNGYLDATGTVTVVAGETVNFHKDLQKE